eukprot:6204934-Pleurochrysis_carterae.AAC.2
MCFFGKALISALGEMRSPAAPIWMAMTMHQTPRYPISDTMHAVACAASHSRNLNFHDCCPGSGDILRLWASIYYIHQ